MKRCRVPGRRPKAFKPAPHTQRQRHAKLVRLDAEARAEALRVRLHGLPVDEVEPERATWLKIVDEAWAGFKVVDDTDDAGDFAGLERTLRLAA